MSDLVLSGDLDSRWEWVEAAWCRAVIYRIGDVAAGQTWRYTA